MVHDLYTSVDELLAPATLTELTGQPVKYVRCLPMQGGYSGSPLFAVEANGDMPARRFVLKRMSSEWDWDMLASKDHCCRSVTLWQSGLLDQLLPSIDHAILACARDSDGWAILMRDVSAGLMSGEPFTATEAERLLDALAAVHATFWQAPELEDATLGLCDSTTMLGVFSPATAQRMPSTTCPLPAMVLEGWSLLQEMAPPDVIEALGKLMTNPQPLCAALARYPATLVHGDYRDVNLSLAWTPIPQTVMLDWQLAGRSAATVDLAWFIHEPYMQLSAVSTEAAIRYYRRSLSRRVGARFNTEWWQPLWDLGALAHVLRMCCFRAWFIVHSENQAYQAAERRALDAHIEQVRAGLAWL